MIKIILEFTKTVEFDKSVPNLGWIGKFKYMHEPTRKTVRKVSVEQVRKIFYSDSSDI